MDIKSIIFDFITTNATEKESLWVQNKVSSEGKNIPVAFVSASRFITKINIEIDQKRVDDIIPNWIMKDWTLDRLVRVYLLINLEYLPQEKYIETIELLFDTAEINEAVALYASLPILKYPEHWFFRATEAVRSNIGNIFDALAFNNPYPYKHFSELAWNQLVLKCIFNDKPIHLIKGLDRRTNAILATSISDFAHERWAAGRTVPAQVWRLVSKFMNKVLFEDILKLMATEDNNNRIAAALVCSETDFIPAKELLNKHADLKEDINTGKLTWKTLELV